jgi:hypothetical protein
MDTMASSIVLEEQIISLDMVARKNGYNLRFANYNHSTMCKPA